MLHHVGIELREEDVPRALELFAALGFEPVEPPASLAEGYTWVERGGTQVHLMHTEAPAVPPRGHLAVVAADFEAACAALRERGFEPEERRPHWGARRAVVRAPGGHRVELMAAPPG